MITTHTSLKIISALLVLTLSVTQTASAYPISFDSAANYWSPIILNLKQELRIPARFGSIDEMYNGGTNKFIAIIQDAHTNYNAQKNISGLIQFLTRTYDIGTVALEGAQGLIDTDMFRSFPSLKITHHVLNRYVRKGEIGGPQFSAAINPRPLRLVGVDEDSLYRQNLRELLDVLEIQREGLHWLAQLKSELRNRANFIYGVDSRKFDKLWRNWKSGALDLHSFILSLLRIGTECRLDSPSLNHLTAFAKTLNDLTVNKSSSLKKMNAKALFEAIEVLRFETKHALAKSNDELELIHLERYAELFERGLRLELSRREVKEFRLLSKKFGVRKIGTDFMSLSPPRKRGSSTLDSRLRRADRAVPSDRAPDRRLNKRRGNDSKSPHDFEERIFSFYKTAEERDGLFVKRLRKDLESRLEKSAILVSGGFHQEGITKLLKKAGYSYAVITPKIRQSSTPENYFRLMRSTASLLRYADRNTLGVRIPFARNTFADTKLLAEKILGEEINALASNPKRGGFRSLDEAIAHWQNQGEMIFTSEHVWSTTTIGWALDAWGERFSLIGLPASQQKEKLVRGLELFSLNLPKTMQTQLKPETSGFGSESVATLAQTLRAGGHWQSRWGALSKLSRLPSSLERNHAMLFALSDPHSRNRQDASNFIETTNDFPEDLLLKFIRSPVVPESEDPRMGDVRLLSLKYSPEIARRNARFAGLFALLGMIHLKQEPDLDKTAELRFKGTLSQKLREIIRKEAAEWIASGQNEIENLNPTEPLGTPESLSLFNILRIFIRNYQFKNQTQLYPALAAMDHVEYHWVYQAAKRIYPNIPDDPVSQLIYVPINDYAAQFMQPNLEEKGFGAESADKRTAEAIRDRLAMITEDADFFSDAQRASIELPRELTKILDLYHSGSYTNYHRYDEAFTRGLDSALLIIDKNNDSSHWRFVVKNIQKVRRLVNNLFILDAIHNLPNGVWPGFNGLPIFIERWEKERNTLHSQLTWPPEFRKRRMKISDMVTYVEKQLSYFISHNEQLELVEQLRTFRNSTLFLLYLFHRENEFMSPGEEAWFKENIGIPTSPSGFGGAGDERVSKLLGTDLETFTLRMKDHAPHIWNRLKAASKILSEGLEFESARVPLSNRLFDDVRKLRRAGQHHWAKVVKQTAQRIQKLERKHESGFGADSDEENAGNKLQNPDLAIIEKSLNPAEIRQAIHRLSQSGEFTSVQLAEILLRRMQDEEQLFRFPNRLSGKMNHTIFWTLISLLAIFAVAGSLTAAGNVWLLLQKIAYPEIPGYGISIGSGMAVMWFLFSYLEGPRRMTLSREISGDWDMFLERLQNVVEEQFQNPDHPLYLNKFEELHEAYFNARVNFWLSVYRQVFPITIILIIAGTHFIPAYQSVGHSLDRFMIFLGATVAMFTPLYFILRSLYRKYLEFDEVQRRYRTADDVKEVRFEENIDTPPSSTGFGADAKTEKALSERYAMIAEDARFFAEQRKTHRLPEELLRIILLYESGALQSLSDFKFISISQFDTAMAGFAPNIEQAHERDWRFVRREFKRANRLRNNLLILEKLEELPDGKWPGEEGISELTRRWYKEKTVLEREANWPPRHLRDDNMSLARFMEITDDLLWSMTDELPKFDDWQKIREFRNFTLFLAYLTYEEGLPSPDRAWIEETLGVPSSGFGKANLKPVLIFGAVATLLLVINRFIENAILSNAKKLLVVFDKDEHLDLAQKFFERFRENFPDGIEFLKYGDPRIDELIKQTIPGIHFVSPEKALFWAVGGIVAFLIALSIRKDVEETGRFAARFFGKIYSFGAFLILSGALLNAFDYFRFSGVVDHLFGTSPGDILMKLGVLIAIPTGAAWVALPKKHRDSYPSNKKQAHQENTAGFGGAALATKILERLEPFIKAEIEKLDVNYLSFELLPLDSLIGRFHESFFSWRARTLGLTLKGYAGLLNLPKLNQTGKIPNYREPLRRRAKKESEFVAQKLTGAAKISGSNIRYPLSINERESITKEFKSLIHEKRRLGEKKIVVRVAGLGSWPEELTSLIYMFQDAQATQTKGQSRKTAPKNMLVEIHAYDMDTQPLAAAERALLHHEIKKPDFVSVDLNWMDITDRNQILGMWQDEPADVIVIRNTLRGEIIALPALPSILTQPSVLSKNGLFITDRSMGKHFPHLKLISGNPSTIGEPLTAGPRLPTWILKNTADSGFGVATTSIPEVVRAAVTHLENTQMALIHDFRHVPKIGDIRTLIFSGPEEAEGFVMALADSNFAENFSNVESIIFAWNPRQNEISKAVLKKQIEDLIPFVRIHAENPAEALNRLTPASGALLIGDAHPMILEETPPIVLENMPHGEMESLTALLHSIRLQQKIQKLYRAAA